MAESFHTLSSKHMLDTVWPEILAGNLFWRIGGFESNPPIFLPPKFVQSYGFPLNKPGCARPID